MHTLKSLFSNLVNRLSAEAAALYPVANPASLAEDEGAAVPQQHYGRVEPEKEPEFTGHAASSECAEPAPCLDVADDCPSLDSVEPAPCLDFAYNSPSPDSTEHFLRPDFVEVARHLCPTSLPRGARPAHRVLHKPYLTGDAREPCPHTRLAHIRPLAMRKKVNGTERPDRDGSLHNLAVLFFSSKKYSRAESVFKRLLAITERRHGASHPAVAESLHYLGLLDLNKGLYSSAEQRFLRSLAIREQVLGAQHLAVAESLSQLAAIFAATGRYPKAEALYSRSLAIYAKNLHTNRPQWESTQESIALLQRFQHQSAN